MIGGSGVTLFTFQLRCGVVFKSNNMINTHYNIHVTGIGLSCASAHSLSALFNDMAAITNDSTLHEINGNSNFASIISRPVHHLELCDDQNDRVLLNTILALENAMESANLNQSSDEIADKHYLIYLVTSDEQHDMANDLESNHWYDLFTDEDSPLLSYINKNNIKILFEQYSGDITQQLSNACELLSNAECNTIFFGGVGSFMDEFRSYQLEAKQDQANNSDSEGVAFLVLESESFPSKVPNNDKLFSNLNTRNQANIGLSACSPPLVAKFAKLFHALTTLNITLKSLLMRVYTQSTRQHIQNSKSLFNTII